MKFEQFERFEWPSKGGTEQLWLRLNRNGAAWFRMPEAIKAVEHDRVRFVKSILKAKLNNLEFLRVESTEGATTYQKTDKEAMFHTDVVFGKQPHLQVMVCKRVANMGGKSRLIDTWQVLSKIKTQDPKLYPLLFTEKRPIQSINGIKFVQTFSWEDGNLVCTHVPFMCKCDQVGRSFLKWIENEAPIEFQMEPGDVYVVNNHRMVHGRSAFEGGKRLYYRMLTWIENPLKYPKEHGRYAHKVAVLAAKISQVIPVKKRRNPRNS